MESAVKCACNRTVVCEQVKDAIGLGKDPDDASWLTINQLNRETQKMELRGEVLLSIEILPKSSATAAPVGLGRSEPNVNPYLPPPTGRMKWVCVPFALTRFRCVSQYSSRSATRAMEL